MARPSQEHTNSEACMASKLVEDNPPMMASNLERAAQREEGFAGLASMGVAGKKVPRVLSWRRRARAVQCNNALCCTAKWDPSTRVWWQVRKGGRAPLGGTIDSVCP